VAYYNLPRDPSFSDLIFTMTDTAKKVDTTTTKKAVPKVPEVLLKKT